VWSLQVHSHSLLTERNFQVGKVDLVPDTPGLQDTQVEKLWVDLETGGDRVHLPDLKIVQDPSSVIVHNV